MAVRLTLDFNAGPQGAAIPTGGDVTTVNGATFTSTAMHGAFAANMANGTQYVRVVNSGTTTHSGSLYFRVNADPNSSSARIVTLSTSTGVVLMSIRAHSDNKFDIADTTGTRRAASTITWTLNQWYRIDWQWNQVSTAAPMLTVRIFLTPEATTPSETLSWTASGLTAPFQRWQLGVLASTAFSGVVDTFRVADGLEWIGPFAPGVPTAGTVLHSWVGAPAKDGFKVIARTSGATSVRLKVCTDAAMTQNVVFSIAATPDTAGYVPLSVTGLNPYTQYFYQLEDTPAGGAATLIGEVGKARTLPTAGTAQNFSFAFGSCATNNNPDGRSFDSIRNWNPLFMVHLGDFHYRNPTATEAATHVQHWANQIAGMGNGALKNFVRDVPTLYVRSDHDAGPGDNGDSNNASTQASTDGYKQIVPTVPLADTRMPTVGLYFSWVVGRVRFIAVDIRNTDRSPGLNAQSSSKTMLGATQKQWLKDQLLMDEPVKVIVSDVPWPGPASTSTGEDKWWSYDHERTEIGNFIVANNVKCVMLTGDIHSLVADSGAHNAWGGFPIYGASPLANIGGGRNLDYYDQVYNTGSANACHYGRVTVTDDGTTITFLYQGYDAINNVVRVQQTDTFGPGTPPAGVRQTYTFDEGLNGAALAVSGDLIQVSGATYTPDAQHGPFAARIANNTQYFRIANSGTATHSGSLYFKPTAIAGSSSGRIVTFASSNNTLLLGLRAHSDGKFDITTASARVAVSTLAWTLNQWYRLDWQWNQASTAAPSLAVRIFNSPESSTPADSLTYTAAGLTAPCQRWTFGFLTGTTGYAAVLDTFRVTDGLEWLPPFASQQLMATGTGQVWDAETASWQTFTPKVQVGSETVTAVTKIYQDGEWKTTQ